MGDCLSTRDSTSKTEITNVKHLSRSVRKWKAENRHHPEIPTAVTGFYIPLNFSNTNSGDKFLQFDSGREDQNRILIFATNEGLNDMKIYKNWSFDGTFNNYPNILYQLFTIHIQIGKITISRIIAFLPNKSEDTYHKVFCEVEGLVKLSPVSIMCDFEKAAINALFS